MRHIRKYLTITIFSLVFILLFSSKTNVNVLTRNIEVNNKLDTNSISKTLDDVFEEYTFEIDTVSKLTAKLDLSSIDRNELDMLVNEEDISLASESIENEINFVFEYNIEEYKMIITANYVKDDTTLSDSILAYIMVDNDNNVDAILSFDDDSTMLLSELEDNIDNCGWFQKFIKKVAVKVIAKVIIAVIPVGIPALVVDAITSLGINVAEKIIGYNNYNHNKELTEPDDYINEQGLYGDWKLGAWTLNNNGCGAIACYNVMRYLGNPQKIKRCNILL